MEMDTIKSNLRIFYDNDAARRSEEKDLAWKTRQRENFYSLAEKEKKKTLLELGAGTGKDSRFFMDCGMDVTAVDLSSKMVEKCKERGVKAVELDFYSLSDLDAHFDCVWAMNSLLHVPKPDLQRVLHNINGVLTKNGLFYMGVYGGKDTEEELIIGSSEIPRLFSAYTETSIREILQRVFEIISFEKLNKNDIDSNIDFQAIVMRKK